jgi:hypothetical protein
LSRAVRLVVARNLLARTDVAHGHVAEIPHRRVVVARMIDVTLRRLNDDERLFVVRVKVILL